MNIYTTVKSRFTLVELLVVIAIISILASMLLPALEQAREQAKTVQCISNLKQCAMSQQFYADDNDGFQVTYAYKPIVNGKPSMQSWGNYLLLSGHIDDEQVLSCPSNIRKQKDSTYGIYYNTYGMDSNPQNTWGGSVGIKTADAAGNTWRGINTGQVRSPSTFTNIAEATTNRTDYTYAPPGSYEQIYAYSPDHYSNTLYARHGGGMAVNMAYLDGHSEATATDKLWDNFEANGYLGNKIGYYTPESILIKMTR